MTTFEEYKSLAENPPVKEGEMVYVLEKVTVDPLDGMRRQHYPVYGVSRYLKGFCGSVDEAEALMRGMVAEEEELRLKGKADMVEDVFCYYVKEYPLGREITSEYYMDSCRLYDAKGRLLDRTSCSSIQEDGEYPCFRGRPQERMRFREGDIVEFVWRDEVQLGFVVSLSPSVERAWELEQRWEAKGWRLPCMDYSDDCYVVLTTSDYASHHHVDCMEIFEPHFPIPPYMRRRLEERYRKFLNRNPH